MTVKSAPPPNDPDLYVAVVTHSWPLAVADVDEVLGYRTGRCSSGRPAMTRNRLLPMGVRTAPTMWRRALSTSSVSQAPRVVPNRGAYKCWVDIQTRWSDQDAFGHVTNSVFYSYFDTAITHVLIRRFNMMIGQTPTHALPAIPFVVASSCNYHRQISHPSVINAGVSISKLGNSSVTYQIGIFTSDGDRDSAAASGTLVHVFVDRDSHRPIPLPADLRQDLSEILVAAPAS